MKQGVPLHYLDSRMRSGYTTFGMTWPQENGSHYIYRYIKLRDRVKGEESTLLIRSETLFSFNASCYTQEEWGSEKHNYELAKSEYTVLNIDYK